jgi:ribonuclease HIII
MQIPDSRRKELREIIKNKGIEYTRLADLTHIDYDVLWRQFNTAKYLRQDVHDAVVEALSKLGFISSSEAQIDQFKDDLLDGGATINGAVSLLYRSFKEKVKDHDFSEKDKTEIARDIKTMRRKIDEVLDDMLLTVEMKKS